MTLSLLVQLFQWKPPGVPLIEQPTFYWKLIIYCSLKTCKWYHGIITHHHSSVLLWAWRSGMTNYWKIIGHCGPRRLDFTPILSLSVWVLTWRCLDAYADHIKGPYLMADSEWQFTTKQLLNYVSIKSAAWVFYVSSIPTLCFDIPISGVKSQRGSFKNSSRCKQKVPLLWFLHVRSKEGDENWGHETSNSWPTFIRGNLKTARFGESWDVWGIL